MGCCGNAGRFVSGAAKLVRSEAGIGIAADEIVAERRAACESCDKWEHGRCTVCKCFTWAKTRLTSERCPLGKWSAAS
jgi:hypothetical protein